jgi:hypothetical protein
MDATIENHKNQQAENEFVRRELWGQASSPKAKSDDEMRVTTLGDYHQTVTRQESSVGKVLLGLGMLAAGIGAPATAIILTQMQPEPETKVIKEVVEGESTAETIEVGEPVIISE